MRGKPQKNNKDKNSFVRMNIKPLMGVLLMSLLSASAAQAQAGHRQLRAGDKAYQQQRYDEAAQRYREALEQRNSAQGAYNLGNAAYQQENYDEAIRLYEEAARTAPTPEARAQAFHNLGNAYFKKEDFEKSAEAFKNALRLQPQDLSTKHNLALAQRLIPPPPPKQQPENQQNQQQQNQQQQQQQQQPQNQPQQGDDQQQQQQPQNPNEEEGQQRPQPGEMTREEAERLLKIVEDEEGKTMRKLRKAQGGGCASDKNW